MTAFLPGASVRPVANGAVLARAGRTVVIDGSASLEAAARILSESPASLVDAPEPLRALLGRQGMTTERDVADADRPVAGRADDGSWVSVTGARWHVSGPTALVDAAREALRFGYPDAEISVDETTDDGALELSVVDGAATITVVRDFDGWAVLDTAAVPTWRAWRARVPVSAENTTEGDSTRSDRLDLSIAVGSAFAALHEQLARVGDAARWIRVANGTSRLRTVPPSPLSIVPVKVTAILDPRPSADENGELIDTLTAGADDEFGWWTPPHPGSLTQLPLALAESQVRLLSMRDGEPDPASVDVVRVVGASDTHDGAWVETALGVARVVAGGAAGIGVIAACADLVRVSGKATAGNTSGESASSVAQVAELGLALDSVHRALDDPDAALAQHVALVAGVRDGDDRAAEQLARAVAQDCGVVVEAVSLGAEWDAAGVVVLRTVDRAGDDRSIDGGTHGVVRLPEQQHTGMTEEDDR